MEEISLRPMSFRPGGGTDEASPFSAFSKGAGVKVAPQKMAASSAAPHNAIRDERKKELGVRTITYDAKFLLQFAERNSTMPAGLSTFKGLILDSDGNMARPVPAGVDGGSNNWRPKGGSTALAASAAAPAGPGPTAAAASAAAGHSVAAAASANSAQQPARGPEPVRMITAAELGRQKWAPVKDLTSAAQGKMKLRGILNKLTPDNFDRLLVQVLGIMSVSAEVLRMCIPLIFEKAVAEPTFCALYADLCSVLTRELEAHDYGQADGKDVTFKRELLNTCQDEFEGMEEERERLDTQAPDLERQQHRLKVRQLGTVRLLAELFNKDLVTQPIMRIVVGELMGRGCVKGKYDSDLIECIVQAMTIAGAKMSQSEKIGKHVKEWLVTLGKWSDDTALEARIRFKIKDLADQVRAGWQARHETNTVKKTEDIRKQAHAELGMVQSSVPDYLPGLQLGHVAVQPAAVQDQRYLFPGMGEAGDLGLLDASAVRPDEPGTAVESSTGPAKGHLDDADVAKKANGTFAEFLSIRDYREAEACLKEIAPSVPQEGLIVGVALQAMYDASKEADRELLRKLLVHLVDVRCLCAEGVQAGLQSHTDGLEDLAMDVPMSPLILGKLLAAVLVASVLPFAVLEPLLEKVESCEPKRHLFRHLAAALVAELGQDGAAQMMREAELRVGPLLDADAELEPGVPSVFDFLKMEGLAWVPL